MSHYRKYPRNRQASQRRANRATHIGVLASAIVENVRLQRSVEALHRKGPRSTFELLKEIGAHGDCREFIRQRVGRYASISTADLDAVVGVGLMTAAARMRRSRERRSRGALCVTLEIGWSDLDALDVLGLLDTDEAGLVKISGAVRTHLDQSLTTPRKPARSLLE